MGFDGYNSLVTAAHNGQITIEMSPEGFDRIDKILGKFIDGLTELQSVVATLGSHTDYGLGESYPDATSAPMLVAKLKGKVQGGGNSIKDTLTAYQQAADQLRHMFNASRSHYTGQDSQIASSLFAAVDNHEKNPQL
jgi:hypothetical protein